MNDQDLTSGLQDFFAEQDTNVGNSGGVIGGIGALILHLIVFAFAIYSGYHGIHASAAYREAQGLGNAAGIVGILIIEFTMIGIYLAYFYRRITGSLQKVVAGATFAVGFVLACLGIVGDSQMQAGIPLSSWLASYLAWGLPIAPAIMSLGALATVATEPKLLRQISEALKHEQFEEKKHAKRMLKQDADLRVAEGLANIQLNTKLQAGRYMLSAYRSPEVQAYVQRAALASMPDLMRAIGVDLPHGTIIEGQAIPMPPPAAVDPELPDEPPARRGIVERLFGNRQAAPPVDEPVDDETMLAFVQRAIAEGKLVIPVATDAQPPARPNGPPPPVVGGSTNGSRP